MKKNRSFASAVWRAVLSIPVGETRTYQWIANKIRHPRAYRAVGSAVKKNPFPIVIPCHRVVKSNDDIGDYVLGRTNKQALLYMERWIRRSSQHTRKHN